MKLNITVCLDGVLLLSGIYPSNVWQSDIKVVVNYCGNGKTYSHDHIVAPCLKTSDYIAVLY